MKTIIPNTQPLYIVHALKDLNGYFNIGEECLTTIVAWSIYSVGEDLIAEPITLEFFDSSRGYITYNTDTKVWDDLLGRSGVGLLELNHYLNSDYIQIRPQ